MDVIDSLKPDLIIGNKEENERIGIEELMDKYPVWMSDIYTLEDSFQMIKSLGKLLEVEKKAQEITKKLKLDFALPLRKKGKAVYLIWNDPIMVAGIDTFINQMLEFAGFENLIRISRYPQLSIEQLIDLNPEYVLLSSEPFPFKDSHIEYFQSLLPKAKLNLVDGEIFSWYGTRLLNAKGYFQSL